MRYKCKTYDEPELLDTETDDSFEGEVSRKSRVYIRWVQQSLNQILGTRLAIDGVIGSQTRSAIRSFQTRHGLVVDGIVGPLTERVIRKTMKEEPLDRTNISRLETAGATLTEFKPTPVENPGGGRIKDKTPPKPADLTTITEFGGKHIKLHHLAAQAWSAMVNTARANNIKKPLLLIVSGYRSPERQKRLWRRALEKYGSPQKARKWVAPPGGSPHQTGRAVDLYLGGKNSSANVRRLRNQPAYKWLVANAAQFGFYPYRREPWHWEYNPRTTESFEGRPESDEALELF